MVRYQSNQNIRNKVMQKTSTALKPNTSLGVKTNSRLKRKLIVYRKNDKFYIDHAAAYALNLTNVRAIMLENPHLIEVGLETLYKFQNNEDIEIEYKELNKEKETATRKETLSEALDGLEQGEYGIGLHGIDTGTSAEKQSKALNINSEGLNITNNRKTILSTAISLGTNEDVQRLSQDITDYQFGNGTKMTVVIAVPLYIQNDNGEKIFLGFPEENKRTSGQQYEEHCILDRICGKLNKVPPEFILGYYCENLDGSESFIKNLKHYSNLTQEEREDLYKKLSLSMDDVSRKINEIIANGEIEKLSTMKERMQQLNMATYMVDNAIMLSQRYKKQEKTQSTKGKNGRKVLLGDVQPTNPVSNSGKSENKRRILLDVCKKAKLSDLTDAKETLREGLEEPGKNHEGQEV